MSAGWDARVGLTLLPTTKRCRQVPTRITRIGPGDVVWLSCTERPFMRRTISLRYLFKRYIPVQEKR